MDDEDSAFMATEYLIKKNHKIIGGIFKSDDIQGHLRYKGFVKALHSHGLQLYEDSVFWFTTEDMDAVFQKKYKTTLIARFHNCSAIVCYNDQIAIKLIANLKSNCINVPDNVSIISFDNSTLAELSNPPLTTMIHVGSELGEKAAKMIVDMINTQNTYHEKIKSTLVERDSVKSIVKSILKK
jgi:GntR family transcriptional regulator of arabinose operon